MQRKYLYSLLGLFVGAFVNVLFNLIAAAIQQRAIGEKFNDQTIWWMAIFAILGLLAGYWLSLRIETSDGTPYRGGIKARGVTSRRGKFTADEKTGSGIDVENIDAKDDVILSSSNVRDSILEISPQLGLAAQALNAGGNITIQQFAGNQTSLADQLAFFIQQIGIANPRQDYARSEFEAYCNSWKCLQLLRLAGDDLWENASKESLIKFANQLRATTQAVHEGAIFFEESDREDLSSVLEAFKSFQVNKEELINLCSASDIKFYQDSNSSGRLRSYVEKNRQCKLEYEYILDKIRISFRRKLSG